MRAWFSSRSGFVLMAVAIVGLLGFGSFHPRPTTASQRIAGLESVIKCPACADISIAQSDAAVAGQLRASVTTWVDQGRTDSWIEDTLVARYGPNVLLKPRNIWLFVVPAIVVGLMLIGVATVLVRRGKKFTHLVANQVKSESKPFADLSREEPSDEDEALVMAALWPKGTTRSDKESV